MAGQVWVEIKYAVHAQTAHKPVRQKSRRHVLRCTVLIYILWSKAAMGLEDGSASVNINRSQLYISGRKAV